MAEETEGRSYKWILPLLVGVFCGGLGGSVFTWYVNRSKPTIVTYRVVTTTLSAPEASGLVPDLKVLIGGIPMKALYAHNVELLPRQGSMDLVEVAFSFSSPAHVYGIHTESPSDLHQVNCSGFGGKSKRTVQLPDISTEVSSVQCMMGPILFQGDDTRPFRVTVATDSGEAPRVIVVAKNLELVQADQFSKGFSPLKAFLGFVFGLVVGFVVGLAAYGLKKTFDLYRLARKN